jgi:hypothetical protein
MQAARAGVLCVASAGNAADPGTVTISYPWAITGEQCVELSVLWCLFTSLPCLVQNGLRRNGLYHQVLATQFCRTTAGMVFSPYLFLQTPYLDLTNTHCFY